MGGSDPTAPQNRGPVPSGFGGHSRLRLLRKSQPVFWPRGAGSSNGFVRQDVRQNRKGGTKRKHGNHQSTTQTTEDGHDPGSSRGVGEGTARDRYAEFIDSSTSYVITEALKLLFKRDDEFKRWAGQHTNDNKQDAQIKGEALTKTAKPI